MINRRGFLRGAATFLAAPAIVRASSLMAIKPLQLMLGDVPIYNDWAKAHIIEHRLMAAAHGWTGVSWVHMFPNELFVGTQDGILRFT